MSRIVICAMLVMFSMISHGQSTTKLSPKYQKKLNQIADPYRRALKYKKYYTKDSLKQVKEQLKEQRISKSKKAAKDSLSNIPAVAEHQATINKITGLDSAKIVREVGEHGNRTLKDKTGVQLSNIPTDSTSIAKEINVLGVTTLKDKTGVELSSVPMDSLQVKDMATKESKQHITEVTGVDISGIALDSTAVESTKKTAIAKGEEYLKGTDEFKMLGGQSKDSELGKLTDHKAKLEKIQEELRQASAQNELKKQMTNKAKDFITNNSKQIQQVQSKMTDLKKKYSSVPNSNDLSTARKRTSLEGESFWKRLTIGGNFNIAKTNPVTLDLSLVLGYWINKLFEAGVSTTFRTQFKFTSGSFIKDEPVYGQSLWVNHLFYKNYFGYLEGERMSTVITKDDISTRSWKEDLMLGIGRKFKVTKWMEMQTLVLFNLLYDSQDQLYSSPVVFKTGFRINP